MEHEQKRKNVIFLSSSAINLAKIFAQNNTHYDVFLILDKRFPFSIEDETLDNFYSFTFDKKKIFEKDKERYFDNLALFLEDFSPDIIVCNNYYKLLPQSFIDFMKFRNSKLQIINIHHADLRIKDENENRLYKGLQADIKEMIDEAMIISTIHTIDDAQMDEGNHIMYSYETTIKELKQKGIAKKKEDILNYSIRGRIISYHERTKVLKLLTKGIDSFW